MATASDFSYSCFRQIVEIIKRNFVSCRFAEAPERLLNPVRPLLFLRHDVDVSLERAVEMAQWEADLSIHATYMILTKAPLYRLDSRESVEALREIRRLGHEVGIHFDLEAEGLTGSLGIADLEQALRQGCLQLAYAIGEPVRSFSFHRPIPVLLRGPLYVGGLVNAYAAELMNGYMSDSKATWRDGDPLPKLQSPDHPPVLQVLIHPIWWGAEHQDGAERLEAFFRLQTNGRTPEFTDRFDADLARSVPAVRRRGIAVATGHGRPSAAGS